MKKSSSILFKHFFIYALFCLPFLSYSQTKEESIRKLITITRQDSLMDKVLESTMGNLSIPGTDTAMVKNISERMKALVPLIKEINETFIADEMIGLYDKYYTEREIKKLIAFYKSKVGQKSLTILPALQKDMMTIFVTKYFPKIQKEILKPQKK